MSRIVKPSTEREVSLGFSNKAAWSYMFEKEGKGRSFNNLSRKGTEKQPTVFQQNQGCVVSLSHIVGFQVQK